MRPKPYPPMSTYEYAKRGKTHYVCGHVQIILKRHQSVRYSELGDLTLTSYNREKNGHQHHFYRTEATKYAGHSLDAVKEPGLFYLFVTLFDYLLMKFHSFLFLLSDTPQKPGIRFIILSIFQFMANKFVNSTESLHWFLFSVNCLICHLLGNCSRGDVLLFQTQTRCGLWRYAKVGLECRSVEYLAVTINSLWSVGFNFSESS